MENPFDIQKLNRALDFVDVELNRELPIDQREQWLRVRESIIAKLAEIVTATFITGPEEVISETPKQPVKEKTPVLPAEINEHIVESGNPSAGAQGGEYKRAQYLSDYELAELFPKLYESLHKPESLDRVPVRIVRYDPLYGTYDEHGKMLADATDSPKIAALQTTILLAISEMARAIAQEDYDAFGNGYALEALFQKIGAEQLDALSKKTVAREVHRLLAPTSTLYLNQKATKFHISNPFIFLVTDLSPRNYVRKEAKSEDDAAPVVAFSPEFYTEYDELETEVIASQLIDGKILKPTTHKQAVLLLDALIGNERVIHTIQAKYGKRGLQSIRDGVHAMAQSVLSWSAYLSHCRANTIRSGREGFSGVVRQVTGSQTTERFEPVTQAPTIEEAL